MADQANVAGRVDDIDRRLLHLLGTDPRASVRSLARAIDMSAGAVGERLERLHERGVIRGFTLDVDPAALGYGLEVLVAIELRQGNPVESTIDMLWGIGEVQSIHLVTGRWDLVLTLLVRDQHHLRDVLLGSVWSVADFQHSETMIILETRRRVGIDPLEGADRVGNHSTTPGQGVASPARRASPRTDGAG